MADPGSAHARHDPLLVVALVDRDSSDARRRAASLVAACRACAWLLADLMSIAAATRALPPVRPPRAFHLSPADAARLRARAWRRHVAAFGTGRDTLSRPLARGFATLGIAGLLMGSGPFPAEDGHVRDLAAVPETIMSATAAAGSAPPEQTSSTPAPVSVLGGMFLVAGLGIGGLRAAAGARRGNRSGPGAV